MDKYAMVILFHLLVIVPLFLWVGFQRAATPEWLYNVLIGMGALVLFYHGYKAVARYFAKSPVIWINLIHVLVVAPLLLWIGVNGKKTGRPAYDMLLMIAFSALGFHMYKLIVVSQTYIKTEGA
jgi:hypothetical protein